MNSNFWRAQKLDDKTSEWDGNGVCKAKEWKWRINQYYQRKLETGRNKIILAGNGIIEIQQKLEIILTIGIEILQIATAWGT